MHAGAKYCICIPLLCFFLSSYSQVPFTNYEKGLFSSTPLISKEPVPGKVEDESRNEKLETTDLILCNGITVTLKSTATKKDEILMDGWRVGGFHKFRLVDKQNARYAADIVRQMGVSKFSPADVKYILSEKKLSVLPYINDHEEGIEGSCGSKDFESFLQMVYLYFTEPRKDSAVFKSYINRQKKAVQFSKDEVESCFRDTMWKAAYNNNPWVKTTPTPADFDKIDLDKTYRIYKQLFGNAYGMHFTFVGKLDDPNIRSLLEKYIASLPTEQIENMPKDNGIRLAENRTIVVQKGTEQQGYISMIFEGESDHTLEDKIKLACLLEITNIMIYDKLKGEVDSNYSGGLYGSIMVRPYVHYDVYANFPCEPSNIGKLNDSIIATIRSIQKNGINKKMLDKIKEIWKRKYRSGLQSNSYWIDRLTNAWINEEDPEDILNYEETLSIISPADIQDAAKQYLPLDKAVRAYLIPENVSIPTELKKAF